LHEAVLDEILEERLPARRCRRTKRGVKRKMSPFPIRKKSDPGMPDFKLKIAIQVLN
jgi:hypothetical protein